MIRDSLISQAFRQFASMIDIDKELDEIASPDDLKAWFRRLPWDEKAFKVNDDRTSTDHGDGSAGNWLARICKEGPCLALTPTMNVVNKGAMVGGAQFWKRLALALHQTHNGFHLGRADKRSSRPSAESTGLALNHWNRSHFQKWTQAPERPHRDDGNDSNVSDSRRAYSMFYQ